MQPVLVTPDESGQKLLQFLKRRLGLHESVLHRFIRQGQVRLNGKRTKPFAQVQTGDLIRIPPYYQDPANTTNPQQNTTILQPALPPLVACTPDLWVFNKPQGLAIHGGTSLTDSLAARLQAHYPQADFRPTPIHRLDKDTSGLILIARNYQALRHYAELFQDHTSVHKEYLAYVHGQTSWHKPTQLQHHLLKTDSKVILDPTGKLASLTVTTLQQNKLYSLVHIALHTGRTHQIRVQMAATNHPVVGDHKYGYSSPHTLKLHAYQLQLENLQFHCLPQWTPPFHQFTLTPTEGSRGIMPLAGAGQSLAGVEGQSPSWGMGQSPIKVKPCPKS